jgi:hypothetical protein
VLKVTHTAIESVILGKYIEEALMRISGRIDKSPEPARGLGPAETNTDAFISHASTNSEFAGVLDRALQADKLKTWVDRSDVRYGAMMRNQIKSALQDSRVLVLVWSKAALESRWVMAEIFMAFYLQRFIIPCVLDATPLPQFLANAAYLDRRRDNARMEQELCRAVRAAPAGANEVAAAMVSQTSAVQALMDGVAAGQYAVLATVGEDLEKAAEANRHVGDALRSLQKMAPLHPMVLNLAGYQSKNDYMIKHWGAIQAGQAPKDLLLDRGERYFFESLCVNPNDESAINGLGSILFYERELDAAEFFQRCAIDKYFRRTGRTYDAAQHDLDMVLRLKRQSQSANTRP